MCYIRLLNYLCRLSNPCNLYTAWRNRYVVLINEQLCQICPTEFLYQLLRNILQSSFCDFPSWWFLSPTPLPPSWKIPDQGEMCNCFESKYFSVLDWSSLVPFMPTKRIRRVLLYFIGTNAPQSSMHQTAKSVGEYLSAKPLRIWPWSTCVSLLPSTLDGCVAAFVDQRRSLQSRTRTVQTTLTNHQIRTHDPLLSMCNALVPLAGSKEPQSPFS